MALDLGFRYSDYVNHVSATEASRNFSELLDRVVNQGEQYTILRHGRVVAQLIPAPPFTGADLKALLRSHLGDKDWRRELADLRAESVEEGRIWR